MIIWIGLNCNTMLRICNCTDSTVQKVTYDHTTEEAKRWSIGSEGFAQCLCIVTNLSVTSNYCSQAYRLNALSLSVTQYSVRYS